jgi:hypothetical protein
MKLHTNLKKLAETISISLNIGDFDPENAHKKPVMNLK